MNAAFGKVSTSEKTIPFIDLDAQRARIAARLDTAIARVLSHGHFIMGPEVRRLEEELADFCGARHVISCSNGTDALALVLMAMKVRPGDAIFVPSFTFVATAEVVAWLGATPIFVDVEPDTFNLDPESLVAAVAHARSLDLRCAGIIPVDLFGQAAEYAAISNIAEAAGAWVLADAAQSFGATKDGQRVGTFGLATATSFFPSKPLGCYGDGGAVMTDDDNLAADLRSLRVHGQGQSKYDNVRIGANARLDTIQAAVLLEKLAIFPEEIIARQKVAASYTAGLADVVIVPEVRDCATSAWAQYTVRVPAHRRGDIAKSLKDAGVPTAIYYPRPLHRQRGYVAYPTVPGGCPVSDEVAASVLSLPMHPYLQPDQQEYIIAAFRAAIDV